MKNNKCSYTNKQGIEINTCEDLPITYCKKCGCFYVLDREGNREEISIQEAEQYSE
jgi:hypothetical protein